MPDRSWGQAEVENEIIRLEAQLETTTDLFAEVAQKASNAEAQYRVAYAKAFVRHRIGVKASEKTADALATVDTEMELILRRALEGEQRGLEERCRSLRALLDAVRTLSANVRIQS